MLKIGPKAVVASFDVDAQNGFTDLCPDELPIENGHTIVSALNKQASFAQYRIASKDAHPANPQWLASDNHPAFSSIEAKNMLHYWPNHCVPGTEGFKLISGLPHPSDYDYVVWKGVEPDMHPYGACYHDLHEKLSTGIIEFLICKKVTTVLVGGLATDLCVKNTVLQLLKARFRVILNLEASRGLNPIDVEHAIEQMKKAGAEIISSTTELVVEPNRITVHN